MPGTEQSLDKFWSEWLSLNPVFLRQSAKLHAIIYEINNLQSLEKFVDFKRTRSDWPYVRRPSASPPQSSLQNWPQKSPKSTRTCLKDGRERESHRDEDVEHDYVERRRFADRSFRRKYDQNKSIDRDRRQCERRETQTHALNKSLQHSFGFTRPPKTVQFPKWNNVKFLIFGQMWRTPIRT